MWEGRVTHTSTRSHSRLVNGSQRHILRQSLARGTAVIGWSLKKLRLLVKFAVKLRWLVKIASRTEFTVIDWICVNCCDCNITNSWADWLVLSKRNFTDYMPKIISISLSFLQRQIKKKKNLCKKIFLQNVIGKLHNILVQQVPKNLCDVTVVMG